MPSYTMDGHIKKQVLMVFLTLFTSLETPMSKETAQKMSLYVVTLLLPHKPGLDPEPTSTLTMCHCRFIQRSYETYYEILASAWQINKSYFTHSCDLSPHCSEPGFSCLKRMHVRIEHRSQHAGRTGAISISPQSKRISERFIAILARCATRRVRQLYQQLLLIQNLLHISS